MNFIQRVLQRVRNRSRQASSRERTAPPLFRPSLEVLEARTVPSTVGTSAITSNFNGTAIPAGDTLWFSSVFKISGLGTSPATVQFTNETITYTANGTTTTVGVPDAAITFSPSATTATTAFNAATNAWETTLPMKYSGNGYLSGAALPLSAPLPGGSVKSITWQGQFTSATTGLSINWQWAAAVYTRFSTDYNALNVKPVDDSHLSAYLNSDHAGTPEAFRSFVVGGARGGGGSNFTGSYSATGSVTPGTPSLASVSGTVTDTNGVGLDQVPLALLNSLGQTVATTTTDTNGFYQFTNLPPDDYTVMVTAPEPGYQDGFDTIGTVNGSRNGSAPGPAMLSNIHLTPGDIGINYNFVEIILGS